MQAQRNGTSGSAAASSRAAAPAPAEHSAADPISASGGQPVPIVGDAPDGPYVSPALELRALLERSIQIGTVEEQRPRVAPPMRRSQLLTITGLAAAGWSVIGAVAWVLIA